MEALNFGYSLKNIPTRDEKSYKLWLLEKIEVFIKKQKQKSYGRWQTGFNYGLRSGKSSPQVKDLIQFEDDLVRILKELKFRKVNNEFDRRH